MLVADSAPAGRSGGPAHPDHHRNASAPGPDLLPNPQLLPDEYPVGPVGIEPTTFGLKARRCRFRRGPSIAFCEAVSGIVALMGLGPYPLVIARCGDRVISL
jgi:hypothetical protein